MTNLAAFALRALLATRPDAAPTALWRLQLDLIDIAQGLLGTRDLTQQVFRPSFADAGPHLMIRANNDGAWCELSTSAGGSWPLTIHQMAHESVHLLNPGLAGTANTLEEGVAVMFSQYASTFFGLPPLQPTVPAYVEALELFQGLPRWFRDRSKSTSGRGFVERSHARTPSGRRTGPRPAKACASCKQIRAW